MKKEAYYFSHDANARNDVKCLKLRRELGLEGYGIFWCIVEMLRESPDYKLGTNTIEDIAHALHMSKEKVESVIIRYDLFRLEGDMFYSVRLNRSMQEYNERKKKLSDSGKRGNEARWGSLSNRVAIGRQSQIKESKKKETKEDLNIIPEEPYKYSCNGFFDKEIEENKSHPEVAKYELLVKFLHGMLDDESIECKNILSLKCQISFKEYLKLKETEDVYRYRRLQEVLEAMENRKNLRRDYTSVYLTAKNWLKTEPKNK